MTKPLSSTLNAQIVKLRQSIDEDNNHDLILQSLLSIHASLHSAKASSHGARSYEDEILDDMPAERMRWLPADEDHSVAWLIWHIARCEDITMNLLVAGEPQVLHQGDWFERLEVSVRDTGNTWDAVGIIDFSCAVDLQALRAYRCAVGRQTQEIIHELPPGSLMTKVDPGRIQQVWDQEAVLPEASGIVDYWASRTIAGLLLMPATRHNLTHLNEAFKIKKRRT